jgi:hypothetical protein
VRCFVVLEEELRRSQSKVDRIILWINLVEGSARKRLTGEAEHRKEFFAKRLSLASNNDTFPVPMFR